MELSERPEEKHTTNLPYWRTNYRCFCTGKM
jgi:hypothetical protein